MILIRVIDSHTGGEPTRLVMEGGPELGEGPLSERLTRFRERFDTYRSAIVSEPRGSQTMVGALLCTPHRPDCRFGALFFDNVGYPAMCGHGTIGLVASLAHAGLIAPGSIKIDTPVGPVNSELHPSGTSAQLACLAADGKLAENAPWVQESITGSTFSARYCWLDAATGEIVPFITGAAHITAEAMLRLDPNDRFAGASVTAHRLNPKRRN